MLRALWLATPPAWAEVGLVNYDSLNARAQNFVPFQAHFEFLYKGNGRGTPNDREPQEYSRDMIGTYLLGSLCSCYFPAVFLGFPVWVLMFLLLSCYIIGVPCLGFPLKPPYCRGPQRPQGCLLKLALA